MTMRLTHRFELAAQSPFSYELTLRKPAGWWWATPSEVYEGKTLWSAIRFKENLLGVKFSNLGTTDKPRISCAIYSSTNLAQDERQKIEETIRRSLRTNEDLNPFYEMAERDEILGPVVKDLWGMRILWWPDLFPSPNLSDHPTDGSDEEKQPDDEPTFRELRRDCRL